MQNVEKAVEKLGEVLEFFLITDSKDYLLKVVNSNFKAHEIFNRNKSLTYLD